jgi:hypothetical protein
MHYLVTVALPATTLPEDIDAAASKAMDNYSHLEQPDGPPGGGWWGWWTVGGRWHGWYFALTAEATDRRRNGTLDLPREGECHLHGCAEHSISRVDCARVRDIDPFSFWAPAYWIDLNNGLGGNEEKGTDANIRFLRWIQSLPRDTWLVAVDAK